VVPFGRRGCADAGSSRSREAAGAAEAAPYSTAVTSRSPGPDPRPADAQPADPDAHLLERTVDSEVLWRGRYLTFRIDTIEDASGARHRRAIAAHPGAVAIVAVDGDAILFVRQFRTAAGRVLLEIPAGTLDTDEDGTVEDPALAAPRELEEETGFRAGSWRLIGRFYTAPGFTSERMHLFLATDVRPAHGDRLGPDADERLDLVRLSLGDALAAIERGEIEDAKTIVGILWLARLHAAGEA
jgi:8-oxo-dGTP pyrophosphatase MutT (NUDIX family)